MTEALHDADRLDLWKEAFERLRSRDMKLVQRYEGVMAKAIVDQADGDTQTIIQSVLRSQRANILRKQWRFHLGGKSIVVNTQIDRIIKIVKAFRDVGTIASNADPVHAGLPWAGVCMLLTVSLLVFTY